MYIYIYMYIYTYTYSTHTYMIRCVAFAESPRSPQASLGSWRPHPASTTTPNLPTYVYVCLYMAIYGYIWLYTTIYAIYVYI